MNPYSEIVHDLRLLPCLSGLAGEEISFMEQMARPRKVPKGIVLFEEEEAVEFFFIVKQGAVKLYKTSKEGRELIVKIMGPGDYFCCAPLYAGGKYFVGAVALEDSLLITIPAEDFKKTLRSEVTEMGWKVISGLCNKIRYLAKLVEDLTFKDVEERVILTLAQLAEDRAPDTRVASLQLTHQDIASMTGTVREVVSRAMSRLKKEGVIIDSTVKGFRIDKEKLLKLLHKRMSAA
jgi:CRP/FNR family transcriptional regulator